MIQCHHASPVISFVHERALQSTLQMRGFALRGTGLLPARLVQTGGKSYQLCRTSRMSVLLPAISLSCPTRVWQGRKLRQEDASALPMPSKQPGPSVCMQVMAGAAKRRGERYCPSAQNVIFGCQFSHFIQLIMT